MSCSLPRITIRFPLSCICMRTRRPVGLGEGEEGMYMVARRDLWIWICGVVFSCFVCWVERVIFSACTYVRSRCQRVARESGRIYFNLCLVVCQNEFGVQLSRSRFPTIISKLSSSDIMALTSNLVCQIWVMCTFNSFSFLQCSIVFLKVQAASVQERLIDGPGQFACVEMIVALTTCASLCLPAEHRA